MAEEDKGSNPDCPQVQVHRSTQTVCSGGGGGGKGRGRRFMMYMHDGGVVVGKEQ